MLSKATPAYIYICLQLTVNSKRFTRDDISTRKICAGILNHFAYPIQQLDFVKFVESLKFILWWTCTFCAAEEKIQQQQQQILIVFQCFLLTTTDFHCATCGFYCTQCYLSFSVQLKSVYVCICIHLTIIKWLPWVSIHIEHWLSGVIASNSSPIFFTLCFSRCVCVRARLIFSFVQLQLKRIRLPIV